MSTIQSPDEAIDAMIDSLDVLPTEPIDHDHSVGRVLAEPIVADRDSPAADLSAMDGYAVRLDDVKPGRLDLADSVLPGAAAPPMPIAMAVRVMTGAVVPAGAQAVIKREDVEEHDDHIVLPDGLNVQDKQNIRFAGENLQTGQAVVEPGTVVSPSVIAAMVSFGAARVNVHRKLRVAIVVTGDELLNVNQRVEPWQIRDSNGPTLAALAAGVPWIECVGVHHAADQNELLIATLAQQLDHCDALLVTGGVSAGTHDFVPSALKSAGCRIVYHKLRIRPGKPMLGAVGPAGQAVFGLPGNPLSVMATARRIAMPVLAHRAGYARPNAPAAQVTLQEPGERTIPLHWMRPVRMIEHGVVELVASKGSGDVPSAARSDGFVELPPDGSGPGPWPYYRWSFDA